MKYVVEKDWVTEAGLRAVVIATPMGHRCGYVGVDGLNKNYGLGYDDVHLSDGVHGGLTYARSCGGDYPVEADGVWWFGFDCAHYDDAKDWSIMDDKHKEVYRTLPDLSFEGSVVRDLSFCVAECESLARQLQGETK